MKRLVTILFLGLFFFFRGSSRELDKGFIAVHGGVSIPVGAYASTNDEDNYSGYAKMGGNLALLFTFCKHKEFGIAVSFNHNSQVFNTDELIADYYKYNPSLSFGMSSEKMKSNFYLVGPTYSYHFETIELYGRIAGGIANCILPSQELRVGDGNGHELILEQAENKKMTLAYGIGFTFKTKVQDHVTFIINADFLKANPYFNAISISSNTYLSGNDNYHAHFNILNFGAGFGFWF